MMIFHSFFVVYQRVTLQFSQLGQQSPVRPRYAADRCDRCVLRLPLLRSQWPNLAPHLPWRQWGDTFFSTPEKGAWANKPPSIHHIYIYKYLSIHIHIHIYIYLSVCVWISKLYNTMHIQMIKMADAPFAHADACCITSNKKARMPAPAPAQQLPFEAPAVRGAGPAHSAWGNPQLLGGSPHLKTGVIWCCNML